MSVRVAFYQRKRLDRLNYGIEQVFDTVRAYLPLTIEPTLAISPCVSRGLWRRTVNLLVAPFQQGDLNHVTGDIHYVTFLLARRRTILTVHDCGFENHPNRVRAFFLVWLWLRLPEKRVSLITTISNFSKQRIVAHTGCNPEKVVVIGDCISPVFSRHDKAFDSGRPRILHVGTSSNKNLERTCQALIGIPCTLRVVGPLSSAQQRALVDSGIQWSSTAGISDEQLFREYGDCDLVVFASTYEGFGLPIIEGNTVGRAVVTSNITSMPEVAGSAACLVDPFDVTSIRRGILRVIGDKQYRDALIEKGYSNAQRFTPVQCADGYLKIYNQMAHREVGADQPLFP